MKEFVATITHAIFVIFALLSVLISSILSWTISTSQYARYLLISIPIILAVQLMFSRDIECRGFHNFA